MAICVLLAAALAPCPARCAEPARTLAERLSVSLTETPAPTRAVPGTRPRLTLTSELAPSVLHGARDVPELWLAQRTIDRDWGLSEDSTYRTVDIQGYKSEGWAMIMSAALPGTGQLYVG